MQDPNKFVLLLNFKLTKTEKEMNWPWLGVLLAILATLLISLFHCMTRRGGKVVVNWPAVGMLPSIVANRRRLLDHVTSMLREFDNTFMFKGPWFSGMDFILTCSPANANHMFNLHFSNYPKGDEFAEIFDVLGGGILNVDGDSWLEQRRMALAHMNTLRFRSSVGECTRNKLSKVLLPLLNEMAESDEMVDLSDVVMRFMFDTTCTLVLGVDPRCLASDFPSVPFAVAIDRVEQALVFRHTVPMVWWKLLRRLRMGREKIMAEAMEVVDRFVGQCIRERRETPEKFNNNTNEEGHIDMMTAFIDHSDDKFMRDTLVTYLAAGKDSTGAAIIWMLWLLTNNPDAEKKMVEELRKLRPSSRVDDHEMTVFKAEEVESLVYLNAVLCETLRLCPSVPFNHKSAKNADTLPSGHEVGPGTRIILSLYSMGRMETIWGNDCLDFKPERWITEKGTLKYEPSYKFIAFHFGPRSCLGKNMSVTQIKLVAAATIYNFDVQAVEGHIVEPSISVVMQAKNGLLVKLKRRQMKEC